ncbi:XRE family transcriptional regulator [Thermasporomyces composti]|uniref:Transcriptional regulator n=1 Tax=Thermasporomyces composti TaxID=696763 RepID=A0A3D9V3U8_THECX|nr:XRE family transcriptional regulator [Thermasporomyces composti]REF36398.1 hypothetical protein DFJ64_1805 [Thermasporomyces composti]
MANDRLAALMREAGFSAPDGSVGRKVFARAVQEVAASHGVVRKFNHTYVSRWLRGVLPRDVETRGFIAEALAKRLGRPVALHEIGLDSPDVVPPDLGTRYPAKHTESTQVLARLLQADLDQLPIFLRAVPDVAAWNEAALTWLVSSGPPERPTGNTGHRVGTADVARVRAMVRSFDQLDGQFGGGHARRALVEYLRHDLTRLLSGTYSEEVGRQLFEAAAQALQLVAWMSYDAGLHDLAGRYFVQALRLAESSGNRLLAASVLDAMSHQATFLGRLSEAVNLARSARLGTSRNSSPILTAHFYMMEARALARLGDTSGCDKALAAAIGEFDRRIPGDGPPWIQYFDDAEMAAEMGHCNRDLGRAEIAAEYASQSVRASDGGYARSDFFAAMVLADSYLDQGEEEQACRIALDALEIGEQLSSARCRTYVQEFRDRLAKVGFANRTVREFVEQARSYKLWTTQATTR